MKKRSSAGLVCCFNSQRDEGQARSPWEVGVTTDVLLACLLLLHSNPFKQARKHEPALGLGIGLALALALASTKANKNMRATIYVIGGA